MHTTHGQSTQQRNVHTTLQYHAPVTGASEASGATLGEAAASEASAASCIHDCGCTPTHACTCIANAHP